MKLNKINTTEISKFFSSAAVIYGSALVQHAFSLWLLKSFDLKQALFLQQNDIPGFKNVLLNETAFSFGGYKLVDSVFSFDSINSKANAAAAFSALGSILYSKIAGLTLLSKTSAVEIICTAAAAYLLTYINSEDQPNVELVIDAEPVAVDLVGFDKVAEVETYINPEESSTVELVIDAEPVAVDLVGFDKVAEVETYINPEEAFLIESFLDVDFI